MCSYRHQRSYPPFSPLLFGIHQNVSVSSLRGYTLAKQQQYSAYTLTTSSDLNLCAAEPYICLGAARQGIENTTVELMACASTAFLLAPCCTSTWYTRNEYIDQAFYDNGAYWYNYDARSVGFSPSPAVYLGYSDTTVDTATGSQRVTAIDTLHTTILTAAFSASHRLCRFTRRSPDCTASHLPHP